MWPALKYGYQAVDREILHNIDDIFNYVSYSKNQWKFINGSTQNGEFDVWLGEPHSEDEQQWDARALMYEETIRNSSVWQILSKFNANSEMADITALRTEASINCLYNDSNIGISCNPLIEPCLFDIEADPCEQNNVYDKYQNSIILQDILKRIEELRMGSLEPLNRPEDPQCNPKNFKGEWSWWENDDDINAAEILNKSYGILFVCVVLVLLKF